MASASPSLPAAAPKRRKFGTYSFALAILAFVLFTVAFGVATSRPNSAHVAALWFFGLIALVVTPLMELTGIMLGIAALFRAGDRKILGLLGAVLNFLLLVGGVGLGIIVIAQMSTPLSYIVIPHTSAP
jgi:hypothetical protein